LIPKYRGEKFCSGFLHSEFFGAGWAVTPSLHWLSPGHSDIPRFRPRSPVATGNHLGRAEKIPKFAQTTGSVDFLIRVQVFRYPLRGGLRHVQVFVNDGHNPLTWDAQQTPLSKDTIDSALWHREVGRAKNLTAPLVIMCPSVYKSLLVRTLLATHFRRRGLLLHLITLTHTHTLGMTALDEGSAHRRDPYFTTHKAFKRQTSMPPAGLQTAVLASGRTSTPLTARPQIFFALFLALLNIWCYLRGEGITGLSKWLSDIKQNEYINNPLTPNDIYIYIYVVPHR
jgi:hypothetical protein